MKRMDPCGGVQREWTILAYLDGNNNLSDAVRHQLNDLERVCPEGDRVTILAEMGTLQKFTKAEAAERRQKKLPPVVATVDRYVVRPGRDDAKIESDVVEKLGDRDMADPATLKDFLEWGIRKYPARHYLLILKDHGSGMKGLLSNDPTRRMMSVPALGRALEAARRCAGHRIDVVAFDMCKMAQAEVAHEIRHQAKYMVASQEEQRIPGLPVGDVVATLLPPGARLQDRVTAMVEAARTTQAQRTFTTSAVRLGKMDEVKAAVDRLGEAIVARPDLFDAVRQDVGKSQQFHGSTRSPSLDPRDLRDIAENLLADARIDSQPVREACQDVLGSLERAVVASQCCPGTYPIGGQPVGPLHGAHGLSIYAPVTEGNTYEKWDCDRLAFARESGWARMLRELNGPAPAGAPLRVPMLTG